MNKNILERKKSQHRGLPSGDVLVDVQDLKMHFPVTEGVFVQSVIAMVKAVNGISFQNLLRLTCFLKIYWCATRKYVANLAVGIKSLRKRSKLVTEYGHNNS